MESSHRIPTLRRQFPQSGIVACTGGKHVMSIYMQYAPYKLRDADWDSQREQLGDTVVRTLAEYAPDLPALIEAGEVITPKDLEQTTA